jgi:hypothetical protein
VNDASRDRCRIVGSALAHELIHAFLNARFDGEERHLHRLAKVTAMENRLRALQVCGQSASDISCCFWNPRFAALAILHYRPTTAQPRHTHAGYASHPDMRVQQPLSART